MNDFNPYILSACMLLAGILTLTSCGGTKPVPADLVLRDGKVATVDKDFTIAEAVAVRGDSIVAVGTTAECKRFIGPKTQIIELEGKLALPGLIDAHAHIDDYSVSLLNLDFRGTTSFQQIADMVAERAKEAKPGEWIIGRSWDQEDWDETALPTHHELTKAAPNNPVWLTRVDGHAAVTNQKGLEISGVTNDTPDPDGGEIIRDEHGRATGCFVDNAMPFVSRHIPGLSMEQRKEALTMATENCLAVGLTGIHNAGSYGEFIDMCRDLIDHDELGVRIYAMMGDPGDRNMVEYFRKYRLDGYGRHFLTVRSVKLFMDGALGSRGAAMFEPYDDRPGYDGLLTMTTDHGLDVCRAALEEGYQVCTHAIGDRGNNLILNVYEQALGEHPADDHRFRIEHAQVLALNDIPRIAELGVLASMQPTHATSDGPWVEARIGVERAQGAYAWRKVIDSGAIVPCGSDFPVEEINPMLGVYAAVTRRSPSGWPGPEGWMPGECMTRQEVIRGFTILAAYAAFQEDILGSIETGKLADIVVMSKDVLTVPAKEILDATPVYTIVGGKIRYQNDSIM